jgi:signal peptide peptidase SppA
MSSEVPSKEAESGEGGFFDSLRRMLPEQISSPGPLVPVLRFTGPIGVVTPLRPGLSLSTTAMAIQRAFSIRGAKAVAIQINSPGGSPVQSVLIHNRIRTLAKEKKLPVYTFAEDVAASGGYILAMAGDEIYADESSIVGSIGVISAGFGFDKLIDKIGVDRRVHTAGKNKMTLDPFQPEKPEDVKRIKAIQEDVHEAFINLVKERRGEKLNQSDDTLFTGAFWSGKQAVDLGLIDGLADIRSKMREKFGKNVRTRLVAPERSLFRRRLRGVFAKADTDWPDAGFSVPSFSDELISALEARALWSRFGL